jgi:type IV pilus assembly protein PilM
VIAEARMKTKVCAFSIPDFSTFFTNFTLPPMTKKELPEAVLFEARQHIPLPIENVTVDWQLVGGGFDMPQKIEVTVAAIPNEIISRYKEIATKAKVEILLLEAEMFGLTQALVPANEVRPVCLIDIGSQSTVCSLIENRVLRYSHSFDRGSAYLANELIDRLPLDPEAAANVKQTYGLRFVPYMDPEIRGEIKKILSELLAPIFREVEMMFAEYRRVSSLEIAKIIFSGGAFAVSEIKDQFSDYFKIDIEIADPFSGIEHPANIAAELKTIGPMYSVAVGMARRGLELEKK